MKQVNPESSAVGEAKQNATPLLAPSDEGHPVPNDAAETPEPFSAEELQQISAQITEEWFRPVENNRLALMEVDPWRLHAYWNLAETDIAQAQTDLSPDEEDAALVLRFTDLSPRAAYTPTSPTEHFDVEVPSTSDNRYIDLGHDAKHYSAELGLRATDGHFVPLTRSNEVETPRSSPSPQLDFRHQEVHVPPPLPAERMTGGEGPNDELLRELFPEPFPPLQNDSSIEEEGIGQTDTDFSLPQGGDGAVLAAFERPIDTDGFPTIDAAEIEPYRANAREAEADTMAGGVPRLPAVPADIVSPTDIELQPQFLLDWLEAQAEKQDASRSSSPEAISTARPHVALEAMLAKTPFSAAHDGPPIDASAQILIQGHGAPDTLMTLFGERVQVQADGRFTVRLPLHRGAELAALLHLLRNRHGSGNSD